MRLPLRRVALTCLVAIVLPQIAIAGIALHVALEHDGHHGQFAHLDAMPAALHGHVHSAEAPDHDHPLTVSAFGAGPLLLPGPLQLAMEVVDVAVGVPAGNAAQRMPVDHPASANPTHVRPTVLRI